ncbi:site-specific integrase [Bacillus paralicheniformis]|uniref:site-specific integrase n=1 Tax=Bacillus paralicheniformis TaxID=1648923 RepID=UPI00128C0680|nr:site-specific integrase [Bacillus paralicheniformis]MPQ27446.1 tyrosine-type recombinase/integrase [Bacillus paralicheniformis]
MSNVQPIREINDIERMKIILRKQSERNRFLFVFGINSALRISDMLPLKVKDVRDKDYVFATERKTKKRRAVLIDDPLKKEINEYIKDMSDDDYLFKSSRRNKLISRIQAYRIIRDAAKELGLQNIGTHTMRKTFGYHFYQRTKDIAELKEILNHSSESITKKYIDLNDDTRRSAYKVFGGL